MRQIHNSGKEKVFAPKTTKGLRAAAVAISQTVSS